jgi:beta-fructofuranosidase
MIMKELSMPGHATVLLTPATRLHLWLRPVLAGQTARLWLSQGGPSRSLVSVPGPEIVFLDLMPGLAGEGVLSWNPEDTYLSCAYSYEPDTVADQGIRLLHLEKATRADLAPGIRLRPPMGWMNDPNGFCRAGGRYHLFYQHYPHALCWSDMHWGHATSADLVHWVHQPVLLIPGQPTADGLPLRAAFSGSARAEGAGLRVFFTDHDPDRAPKEFQRSALVPDGLHAQPAAVILPDLPADWMGRRDFRDPYVFDGPDGRLHMVLGSGDAFGGAVLHYTTEAPDGASGWIYRDVLWHDVEDGTTVAECPCLVPVPGGPEPLWALIYARMDARDPETGRSNPTRVVVGRFDGTRLEPLFVQTLDPSCGSYAWQAIHLPGAAGGETLAIGWLADWADWDRVSDFPTAMTLPRRLTMSADGTALRSAPISGLETLRRAELDAGVLALGQPLPLPPCVEVALSLAGPPELALSDGSLSISPANGGIALNLAGRPPLQLPAPGHLRLFIDPGGIEIFADDGAWTLSQRLPGQETTRSLTLGPGQTTLAQVWPLSPLSPATGAAP